MEEGHPMGAMNFQQKGIVTAVYPALQEAAQALTEMRVATPGGRFHVRWDEGGSATDWGQLAFFAVTSNYAAPGLTCRGGAKAREADRPRRAASRVAA